MKKGSYFSQISFIEDEIEKTFQKYVDIIFQDEYFKRFHELENFCLNFPAMFLYLWKEYKSNGETITIDRYTEELRFLLGQETIDQEMKENYGEYQRSYLP